MHIDFELEEKANIGLLDPITSRAAELLRSRYGAGIDYWGDGVVIERHNIAGVIEELQASGFSIGLRYNR